jgi:hypothetical protein
LNGIVTPIKRNYLVTPTIKIGVSNVVANSSPNMYPFMGLLLPSRPGMVDRKTAHRHLRSRKYIICDRYGKRRVTNVQSASLCSHQMSMPLSPSKAA